MTSVKTADLVLSANRLAEQRVTRADPSSNLRSDHRTYVRPDSTLLQ